MTPARPLEVRLAVGILAGAAALFVAVALVRTGEDPVAVRFPIILGVLGALVVATLWLRWRAARAVALGYATVAVLVHVLIALGDLPGWVRAASGALAAAHAYAVVLLLTRPSTEHFARSTP
ncbi:hypothetical protein L6E12_02535 [Actinokineospora sp. PR83]|uniref:hypothetical protein n=1 Tax=Actinokineospora sp. PR83 TaxID=2884908 RepID=UPI001F46B8CF|nr:hypothetical protein [Actinokineospora sp. PR83]MCG8914673.1 hypothetical protein [Actinokineospora sp. PR83]